MSAAGGGAEGSAPQTPGGPSVELVSSDGTRATSAPSTPSGVSLSAALSGLAALHGPGVKISSGTQGKVDAAANARAWKGANSTSSEPQKKDRFGRGAESFPVLDEAVTILSEKVDTKTKKKKALKGRERTGQFEAGGLSGTLSDIKPTRWADLHDVDEDDEEEDSGPGSSAPGPGPVHSGPGPVSSGPAFRRKDELLSQFDTRANFVVPVVRPANTLRPLSQWTHGDNSRGPDNRMMMNYGHRSNYAGGPQTGPTDANSNPRNHYQQQQQQQQQQYSNSGHRQQMGDVWRAPPIPQHEDDHHHHNHREHEANFRMNHSNIPYNHMHPGAATGPVSTGPGPAAGGPVRASTESEMGGGPAATNRKGRIIPGAMEQIAKQVEDFRAEENRRLEAAKEGTKRKLLDLEQRLGSGAQTPDQVHRNGGPATYDQSAASSNTSVADECESVGRQHFNRSNRASPSGPASSGPSNARMPLQPPNSVPYQQRYPQPPPPPPLQYAPRNPRLYPPDNRAPQGFINNNRTRPVRGPGPMDHEMRMQSPPADLYPRRAGTSDEGVMGFTPPPPPQKSEMPVAGPMSRGPVRAYTGNAFERSNFPAVFSPPFQNYAPQNPPVYAGAPPVTGGGMGEWPRYDTCQMRYMQYFRFNSNGPTGPEEYSTGPGPAGTGPGGRRSLDNDSNMRQ